MAINPLLLVRLEKGLKLWQAASAIGLSPSYLCDIERMRYVPPEETKRRIADFYGRQIQELFAS